MALLIHIIIAFSSLLYTALVFMAPSERRLKAAYVLVAGTLASGTFLLAAKPSHLTETCVMGLSYLAIVTFGIVGARRKLATQVVRINRSK